MIGVVNAPVARHGGSPAAVAGHFVVGPSVATEGPAFRGRPPAPTSSFVR